MTVRLTIDRDAWSGHVHEVAAAYGHGLVPVVKGNGYGFGRPALHEVVRSAGAATVCVGSVHELHDVPDALTPVVLTPTAAVPARDDVVLTVGAPEHVAALLGWRGRVMVKLRSSMHRYGTDAAMLPALLDAVRSAGLTVEAFALHLPLAGTDDDRLEEALAWEPLLPHGVPMWVSHLSPTSFHRLRDEVPERVWAVRVGTALWHGIPRGPFLRLTADVLHTERVHAGQPAGYRLVPVPGDGTVVAIGAGSAAGIAPLDHPDPSRRSPFHYARQRLALVEPPHMHTSLVFVPEGSACPAVGDEVDVQRPLTATWPDEVVWR